MKWWPIAEVHWPWQGKSLGTFGVKLKSGFYFDISASGFKGARRFPLQLFICNPNRTDGSFSCKHCRRRLYCIEYGYCIQPRTYISLRLRRPKYPPNWRRVRVVD